MASALWADTAVPREYLPQRRSTVQKGRSGEAVVEGEAGGGGAVVHAELAVDVGHVRLDGARAEDEPLRPLQSGARLQRHADSAGLVERRAGLVVLAGRRQQFGAREQGEGALVG